MAQEIEGVKGEGQELPRAKYVRKTRRPSPPRTRKPRPRVVRKKRKKSAWDWFFG